MFRSWRLRWYWAVFGLVVALLATGLIMGWPRISTSIGRLAGWSSAVPPPPVIRSAPSVEQLQSLAELVSLRVQVIDILTVEQDGWIAGYKGAWLIRGDALWTTNLRHARIQELPSRSGRSVVRIELPPPAVSWARLDHTRTRTYDVRSKSWIPLLRVPDQVRDEALERAQDLVARTAARPEYRQKAQRQAESVLRQFLAEAGFVAEIVWIEPVAP